MRMRKKKHGEERLLQCSEYLYTHEGEALKNPSLDVFGKELPVYLEIGAGKGGFAVGMKKQYPDTAYFAMERVTDCVVLAAERAKKENTEGLRFIIDTADNLTKIFAKGSVDAIFLNFSDPWSKKGYAKRRLTHARYLAVYMHLLKDGGKLCFKTDNVGLFDFSLEQLEEVGLTTAKLTRDLHASEWNEGNVVTEYEAAFSSQGVKINMLEVVKPEGFSLPVPDDLKADRVSYRPKTED
ncbi:MAG: tRNA (guanosine(46)-N7)-methyltransferase TrmB [Clostridia bacterium]|nr:tRNA (guanosine(46)-N7)-methyltransferase TrmB [Clostridia bacterium]